MRTVPGCGVVLALGFAVAACQTVERVPKERLAAPNPPARVWLTLPDHSTIVVASPELHGDTLVGLVDGVRQHFVLTPAGVLTIRKAAPGRTAVLAIGMVGAMGLIEYEMMKEDCPDPCSVSDPTSRCCPTSP